MSAAEQSGNPGGQPAEAGWRVLPEAWASRVSAFICAAGTREEVLAEDRPELIYSRRYLRPWRSAYASYNIRSRHFRCIETFFVETGADGELRAVVGLEGFRADQRVLNVHLLVMRAEEGDPSERLGEILSAVLEQAALYCQVERLRFLYALDTSIDAPVTIHVSDALVHPSEHLPFREEARIPHETGQDREVVMLAYGGGPA